MKRRFLVTAARSGLITILFAYSVIAHCGEDAFAKWAATHALPVTTVESASNDSDLLPLESTIGAAHVVALGEPMHGAHEGSIESTLAGVGLPLMFLDVRMARQNKEALTWLSTRRSYDANVSAQILITLSTGVDAFLFVNTLTPAIESSDGG
jgi:erythromycin esterase-like protein